MVEGGELFEVYWTEDFTEDVTLAVEYVERVLGSPIAARRMLDGIRERLEIQRALPTAATAYTGSTGEKRYIVSYHHYDIHYIIEGRAIKAIGLKHQIRGHNRTTLPKGQ